MSAQHEFRSIVRQQIDQMSELQIGFLMETSERWQAKRRQESGCDHLSQCLGNWIGEQAFGGTKIKDLRPMPAEKFLTEQLK